MVMLGNRHRRFQLGIGRRGGAVAVVSVVGGIGPIVATLNPIILVVSIGRNRVIAIHRLSGIHCGVPAIFVGLRWTTRRMSKDNHKKDPGSQNTHDDYGRSPRVRFRFHSKLFYVPNRRRGLAALRGPLSGLVDSGRYLSHL